MLGGVALMAAMLGLPSLQKLLVLGLVLAVVWYGFKIVGRIKEAREKEDRRRGRRPATAKRTAHSPKDEVIEAEDMVICKACGAYVAARGAGACGKPDCPY